MSKLKRLVNKSIFSCGVIFLLTACQSVSITNGDPNLPDNAFLDGSQSKVGVVLCHGRGKYPTWSVVDPLRKAIHERLGYHTLSIQMPSADVNWREYREFFPEAYKRIAAAIGFLQKEKGVHKVYLMGHSMGSRMSTSYLAETVDAKVAGFIGVGIRNGGGVPLDSASNLQMIGIPVLDVFGDGGDGKDARDAAAREGLIGGAYTQVRIPGADHQFTLKEREMVDAVIQWLQRQNAI